MPDRARSVAALLGILVLAAPLSTAGHSSPDPGSTTTALCEPVAPTATSPEQRDTSAALTVTVAAASDLRYAMDELIATFESADPGRSVQVTYGSSGNFFAQISQGAPFDVYFSADIEYPRALQKAGLAAPDSTRTYAEGRIVTWVRNDSPIDLEPLGLQALLHSAAERVAIANPEHAPYGRAALSAMEASGVWEGVQPRLVLGENVAQAAQFVEAGAADIGIIALSLAISPPLCREGRHALVPVDLHAPIIQGAVVLPDAAHPATAAAFLDFVLGPQGREVLDRYGFLPPEA